MDYSYDLLQMARKKPTPEKLPIDDQTLWADHYEALPDHMDLPADAETPQASRLQQEQKTIVTKYPVYDQTLIKPLPGTSVLRYAHASMSTQLFKKVFQSPFKASQTLDLHHHSGKKAYSACQLFLQTAFTHQHRRCRLICGFGHHSQGQSLLKGVCVYVLQRTPFVLAYRSATPTTGGTGAIDVYLRKAISQT